MMKSALAWASGTAWPMAMDTSAAASTGPSFMPSPTIMTRWPFALQAAHMRQLGLRRAFAEAPFNAGPARQAGHGLAGIARKQLHADTELEQGRHRLRRVGPYRLVKLEARQVMFAVRQVGLQHRSSRPAGARQKKAEPR